MIQQYHFWVYAKEMKTGFPRDICTLMFTASLVPIAKI